jgi:amino acid adenylation domain-containing protein
MIPVQFVKLEQMPLTSSGKIDRRSLPAAERVVEVGRSARTAQEEILCSIFAELLSLAAVGIDQSFFALGGHSLMAMQLVSKIRATFGVELSVRTVFEAPSAAELALQLKHGKTPRVCLSRQVRPEHPPASYAQQRLWFLNQLRGNSAEYNLPDAYRMLGELDIPALRHAVSAIVERHESLRTRFAVVNGKLVQVIIPAQPVEIDVEDLSSLAETIKQERLLAAMKKAGDEPFDLATGPLCRFKLLKLDVHEHVFVRVFHHIAFDAWSGGIFDREFALFYEAFQQGSEITLDPLPVQYVDFSLWQHEWLSGEVLRGQLAYWKKQLEGIPEQLDLAMDHPRPSIQTFAAEMCAVRLSPVLASRVKQLAQRNNATLYMTLLSAYSILLRGYSGQDDMVVGCPISNRPESSLEQMIGFFVNTLPIRVRLNRTGSFNDLLTAVRRNALDAHSHQDLPFEKLVEELSPQRTLNTSPIFQVLLVLQNAPGSAQTISGLETTPVMGYELTVRFDLELYVWETEGTIQFYWLYNRDLFDSWRMEQMARHYTQLLKSIVEAPDQPLWELAMMTEAEQEVLRSWNRTEKRYGGEGLVHEWFEQQVEKCPEAPALIFEGRRVSYAELNREANAVARRLRESGVGPEVLVGLYMERSVEMVVGLVAILKAGGAYVPLDPEYPQERLEWMMEEAEMKVVVTQEKWRGKVPKAKAVVSVETGRKSGTEAEKVEVLAEGEQDNLASRVREENLAYVIYTSGSTGKPKGAMNTHGAIRNRLLWMQEAYGLQAGERVLQKTPFTFDVSVWEFLWPLMVGSCLVVAKPGGHRDGEYLARLIEEEGINTIHFVPSMLGAFLQGVEGERCGSLKRVICSGEALPVEMAEEFLRRYGAELHNLYGPTEAAVDVSYWACRKGYQGTTTPIGKPIANLQLHILNEELQPIPVGVAGEIYIGGEGVGRGYVKRPEWTAERFVPNPISRQGGERLYRTGDKARYLTDGNIEFLGRVDYQVKIRGFRIELGEIEAVMGQHEGVGGAAVVAIGEGEKRLVGYYVEKGRGVEDGRALREFVKGKLPEYMIPVQFVKLEQMPLTSSGKIDRRKLPVPEDIVFTKTYVSPRTAVEELLAQIWAEVLSVEPIGINDNFFDLGGHSILAISLVARIREAMKCNLPLQTIFESPTINQMGAVILQNSERPGQAEKIAALTLRVRMMAPEEKKKTLLRLKEEKMRSSAATSSGSSATGAGA